MLIAALAGFTIGSISAVAGMYALAKVVGKERVKS